MNRRNEHGHRVFTTIGYAIPKAKSQEDVQTLFRVLCGEADLLSANTILGCDAISEYISRHNPEDWKLLKHWVEWWTRTRHLGKEILTYIVIVTF